MGGHGFMGWVWDPSSLTFPFPSPTSVRGSFGTCSGSRTGSARSLTASAAGECHGARPDGSEASIPVNRKRSGQEESQMPVGTEIRMDLDRISQADGADGAGVEWWCCTRRLAPPDQASWGKRQEAGRVRLRSGT